MKIPEQIVLPINAPLGYATELNRALYGWMRQAARNLNALDQLGSTGSSAVAEVLLTVPANSTSHAEIVTFTGCTAVSRLFATIAPHLDTDENDPEMLDVASLSASPGVGTATVRVSFFEPTTGPIRINLMAV